MAWSYYYRHAVSCWSTYQWVCVLYLDELSSLVGHNLVFIVSRPTGVSSRTIFMVCKSVWHGWCLMLFVSLFKLGLIQVNSRIRGDVLYILSYSADEKIVIEVSLISDVVQSICQSFPSCKDWFSVLNRFKFGLHFITSPTQLENEIGWIPTL
mgnify:FL=1